jgi:hypothetical protein
MNNLVRVIVAVVFVAFSLTACDNGDLPPGTQFSAFKGTVVDATTHQPIAGALVIVDSVLTATTDANGAFAIAQVPSGIVDYVVRAKGYVDIVASVDADPGKPLSLNVAMAPPSP